MGAKLRDLFSMCTWENKVRGQLPTDPDEILYIWTEEEADMASHFFGETGSKIFTEEHPTVVRSLYLGQDGNGEEKLCVRQERKSMDMEEVAKGMADMMDATKFIEFYNSVVKPEDR